MQLTRRFCIVISTCTSLFMLYFAGWILLALSVNSYPYGAWLLMPWTLCVFGVVGMIRAWPETKTKSAFRLRADLVLLSVGMTTAIVLTAGLIYILLTIFQDNISGDASILAILITATTLAIFPSMPIALAGFEIYKSAILIRSAPLQQVAKLWKFYAALIVCAVALVGIRILAQEAIMMWYGRNLLSTVYASAEKLAKNAPYCVIDYHGADTFEELNKRRILLNAVEKRWGFHGMNPAPVYPHFGIIMNNKFYWWSFRERKFLQLPRFNPGLLPGNHQCRIN